jgi:undecaprenyl-diphosphatase
VEPALVESLLHWLAAHPHYAGLLVFAIALTESLVIVGLIVPGAVLMFGTGALIATGHLSFWPTFAWAAAGAVVGDGLSYYVGRHYKEQLGALWPFRRRPELIKTGVRFFERHGGKSVLLGRFVGPVRPIIPAVAGMLGMPTVRFFAVNIASALAWAPLYLLPGLAFGASLELASEVTGRLALFVAAVVVVLWIVVWLVHRAYKLLSPRSDQLLFRVLNWSERHPVLGEIPAALVDPAHAEARGLTWLTLVFLTMIAGFAWAARFAIGGSPPSALDALVHHSLSELRTPWADTLMLTVSGLGSPPVLATLFGVVSLWLIRGRLWPALAHWSLAATLPLFASLIARQLVALPRPTPLPTLGAYGFPSLYVVMSTALYGFLAVLLVRETPRRLQPWIYASAGALVSAIGFSRLYLGAHWLVDVAGGLALSLAWISLVGIAYRRHSATSIGARALGLLCSALLLVFVGYAASGVGEQRHIYAPVVADQHMSLEYWRHQGWRALPALRDDIRQRHDHPLTVQWADSRDQIVRQLAAHGWHVSDAPLTTGWLQWFRPDADVDALPVLPQVHAGQHDAVTLVRTAVGTNRVLVLRLWRTPWILHSNEHTTPLWVGSVSYLKAEPLLVLSVLRTEASFVEPLAALVDDLAADGWTREQRPDEKLVPGWNGELVLVWPSEWRPQ